MIKFVKSGSHRTNFTVNYFTMKNQEFHEMNIINMERFMSFLRKYIFSKYYKSKISCFENVKIDVLSSELENVK